MRTLHKMSGKSMLTSICIVGAFIMALFPAGVVGAGSSESGFHISQWTGETWEEIYQHQFQVQYSTETFTVDVVDGRVALRIVQVGTPFADVDQISLMVDGEELTPEYARYTESGQSIGEDILELDLNVVIAHEQEIEISWNVPAGNDSGTVHLTANEYGHALPFQFPETGYATYEMGSNIGSITVDGLINETDGTAPLYLPFWHPSTGHPDGYAYIYICDDEQYIYFCLDVTPDNTNEYGEDWAEIRILQSDGSEQAFRIDDFATTWGRSGFGLTSKASYKHQTCEFAIPKSIIGGENIEFNLAYYGTAGAGAPEVTTGGVDSITSTSALCSGNITSEGSADVTSRGIEYWPFGVAGDPYAETEYGSFDVGPFSESLTSLSPGTKYYYRAFAENVYGTQYNDGFFFLTLPEEPTGLSSPSQTRSSIDLSWAKGDGADTTIIRYQTGSYPANWTDGYGGYSGNGTSCTVSSLNPTTTYYFAAWSSKTALMYNDVPETQYSSTGAELIQATTNAPTNDNFADATVITGASGNTTGTNEEATIEDGEPFHSLWSGGTCTVWWSWTAPTTGTAAFDTLGSNFDTVMSAYTGDNVSSLTLLDESDDAWVTGRKSRIVFKVTAATTYHIAVAGYSEYDTGEITLNWGYATAPANDDFPGIIISGTSGSSVFSSVNATREDAEPMHSPSDPEYAGRSSLWWSWTAPVSGNVTFNTNGSVSPADAPPDTVLAIYTGTSLGSLTLIDYDDWYPYDELILPAVGGTTYRIAIDAWEEYYLGWGSIHLNWSYTPPIFTSAASTTFAVGMAGLFNITTTADPIASSISIISGTLPTGVNFNNDGDGTATLSGTPAAGTGGTYPLTFSASNGISDNGTQNFTLTVNEAPAFVSVNNTTFSTGSPDSFTVNATGYPTPSISLTSGTPPSGVTYESSTGVLSGTPTEGGTFTLIFTASNGVSPDATQNFTLTVNEAPAFVSANSTTFSTGSPDSFTVNATGYPTPSISLTSGTPPSGVTYESSTGVLSGTPTEGGTFTLTFTASNGISPDATQNFTLNVNGLPNITTPPQDVVVVVGQNASFTVEYSAYPVPTFQWQISTNGGGRWSNIRGANSETYDISATTSRMSGNLYRVIISNNLGIATSDPATLTVMPGSYTTANVSIEKSDGVYDPLSGSISWNITVANSGPDTAERVTVVDELARGTRFSSITGDVSETQVKVKGSSVTVTIGSLTNGASVNFTIVVLVTRATSPVDNIVTATVGTTSYDPDLSNNTDSSVCSWS